MHYCLHLSRVPPITAYFHSLSKNSIVYKSQPTSKNAVYSCIKAI